MRFPPTHLHFCCREPGWWGKLTHILVLVGRAPFDLTIRSVASGDENGCTTPSTLFKCWIMSQYCHNILSHRKVHILNLITTTYEPRVRSFIALFSCVVRGFSNLSFFNWQSSGGFFKTRVRPQGFPPECLLCEVEVGNKEYNDVPREWVYEQKYREYYGHFRQVRGIQELEVLSHGIICVFWVFWPRLKSPLNWRKPDNSLQR